MEFFDNVAKIDDPVGAVSVHMANGILGTLAVGLFSNGENRGRKRIGMRFSQVLFTPSRGRELSVTILPRFRMWNNRAAGCGITD